MFIGHETTVGGRVNEISCCGVTPYLKQAGLAMGRLKTGTPARLNGKTINFSVLEKQDGDEKPQPFSFLIEIAWSPSSR